MLQTEEPRETEEMSCKWLEELGFEPKSLDFGGDQLLGTIKEEYRQHTGLDLGLPTCM